MSRQALSCRDQISFDSQAILISEETMLPLILPTILPLSPLTAAPLPRLQALKQVPCRSMTELPLEGGRGPLSWGHSCPSPELFSELRSGHHPPKYYEECVLPLALRSSVFDIASRSGAISEQDKFSAAATPSPVREIRHSGP